MALDTDKVLELLGGNSEIAELLGIDDTTVSTWRRRGIPPGRWASLVRLARRKRLPSITFEALAALPPTEIRA